MFISTKVWPPPCYIIYVSIYGHKFRHTELIGDKMHILCMHNTRKSCARAYVRFRGNQFFSPPEKDFTHTHTNAHTFICVFCIFIRMMQCMCMYILYMYNVHAYTAHSPRYMYIYMYIIRCMWLFDSSPVLLSLLLNVLLLRCSCRVRTQCAHARRLRRKGRRRGDKEAKCYYIGLE